MPVESAQRGPRPWVDRRIPDRLRATVAGTGNSVTALDVVREAVRAGHDGLVRVEATLAALRR